MITFAIGLVVGAIATLIISKHNQAKAANLANVLDKGANAAKNAATSVVTGVVNKIEKK